MAKKSSKSGKKRTPSLLTRLRKEARAKVKSCKSALRAATRDLKSLSPRRRVR